MNGEHIYIPDSWHSITTQVKESLGIKQLSKSQASQMMRMYLTQTPVDEIVKALKQGEKK